jgi:hypothetical protein
MPTPRPDETRTTSGAAGSRPDAPTAGADSRAAPADTPGSRTAGGDGDRGAERRRRRARFLAELAEARQLRARVAPRRTRNARLREALRMQTFRW